ncbi:peptidoglycan-binding protein LysM [Pseudomonas sp. 21LCFQ010]|uniref:peptidoglycan-binding protein LysM n=1 Tax=Pseudomonas sp. 21LCFQ010 TaxID=2957506 RepID=UPI0020985525|nr:peptidoglycan-binding protein LysM [Pseudomonas sp. 21LCFQ010]
MGLIDFVKSAGEKLVDLITPGQAAAQQPTAEQLAHRLDELGLDKSNVNIAVQDGKVVLTGNVANQEQKEKIALAAGNCAGIEQVDDQLTVSGSPSPGAQANFVTVVSGDTLSKIAKRVYGDPNQYQKIFEANQPMLSHPDKIYPGQVLRIPN